jgi:HK97 gp10 family phage protein
MSIEFEGLDNIVDKLDGLLDEQRVNAALGKACALVERSAKQKAPKGIGELRRSITSRVENMVGVVYTPLEYAPYVEYGTGLFAEEGGRTDVPWCYQDDQGEWHTTSGQHPQPYMRPALNENREEIKRIIKEGITND